MAKKIVNSYQAAYQHQAVTENSAHLQQALQKLLSQQAKSKYVPSR